MEMNSVDSTESRGKLYEKMFTDLVLYSLSENHGISEASHSVLDKIKHSLDFHRIPL